MGGGGGAVDRQEAGEDYGKRTEIEDLCLSVFCST